MSRENELRQFYDLIDAFSDPFDGGEMVYHYTSTEGLRGIIDTGEIWLTNTAFVNDTTECRALWQLTGLFADGELTNPFVQRRWESGERQANTLYIVSFSRIKNSLGQWRAYGGFCIGFDVNGMLGRGFTRHKCVYEKDDIHDWIIRKSNLKEWHGDFLSDGFKNKAADHLFAAASRKYKSDHYASEEEVRLAVRSDHSWGWYTQSPAMFAKQPPIHFRDHPVYRMPVPYVKFFIPADNGVDAQWHEHGGTVTQVKRRRLEEEQKMTRGLLPIKEIWLGPMVRQDEAKVACEIMLREKGYENVPVIASVIPYRGS